MSIRPTSKWGAAAWGAIPWGGSFMPSAGGNVEPTSAASRRSAGSVFIRPPGIGPAHAVSRRHVAGPVALSGGTITLGMAFAPTRRALGGLNIAGPVHPAAAVSRRKVGTPFLNAISSISPAAAVSRRAVGNVTVNHVLSIAPAAAISRRATGNVTMSGAPAPMKIYAAVSRRSCGVVAITGGSTELVVSIGGKVWPNSANGLTGVMIAGASDTGAPVSYESANPPTITSQTLGRWTLNIDLFDATGNYAVAVGQTILVTEGGAVQFAGCVQTAQYSRLMGTAKAILWHITATDKSAICDRRLVPVTTFPAGSDVAQVILTIVANDLDGEGILTTAQSVPQDGSLGTLAADLVFNYDTVTNAFNQIGTLSGTIWYVDATGVLWFASFSNLPASPWGLVENGGNFRSLVVTPSNLAYANDIIVVSNLTIEPATGGGVPSVGSNTETVVMTAGNIGVIVAPDGVTIQGVETSLPIGTLVYITVDGNDQTVVELTEWTGQEPVYGTNDYGPWFWTSNGQNVTLSVASGALFAISGRTLVINYTPFATNAAAAVGEALNPLDPISGDPLGTCGSGRYQLAIQVQNVSDVDDLNAIAAAELVKRSGLQVEITFQTDKPGLKPGQLLNVNIPAMYLNDVSFLITYMQGVAATAPLEFGSRFQWEVRAVTDQDPGNWFQWYANLLAQAGNPLPVPQYQNANFAIDPGASVAGGVLSDVPFPVQNTGKLIVMFAVAGVPPVDQNLVITFYKNGVKLTGQVVIPAGSVPNTVFAYQFSTVNPIYVYATATGNDVITVATAYVVTGPNPAPASGVMATLRWTM